jgi:hypothetical protein
MAIQFFHSTIFVLKYKKGDLTPATGCFNPVLVVVTTTQLMQLFLQPVSTNDKCSKSCKKE